MMSCPPVDFEASRRNRRGTCVCLLTASRTRAELGGQLAKRVPGRRQQTGARPAHTGRPYRRRRLRRAWVRSRRANAESALALSCGPGRNNDVIWQRSTASTPEQAPARRGVGATGCSAQLGDDMTPRSRAQARREAAEAGQTMAFDVVKDELANARMTQGLIACIDRLGIPPCSVRFASAGESLATGWKGGQHPAGRLGRGGGPGGRPTTTGVISRVPTPPTANPVARRERMPICTATPGRACQPDQPTESVLSAPLLGHELGDREVQIEPPAPAPNAPCVTGWICIGSGPRRERRIRPSNHVANHDSVKLTVIINTAMTISAGM